MMSTERTRSNVYAVTAALVSMLLILPLSSAAGGPAPAVYVVTPPPPLAAYVVGPGDVLEISVWGYPDLSRQMAVGPDGKITLPLVGSISSAGATVERLIELLVKAFGEFIKDPHVMVTVKEYRKIHVSVLGQVTRPGAYDLPLGTRLLDLLAAGGGPTEVAALKEVQFLRPGKSAIPVDLTRTLAGDPALNLPLVGGETLVVPEDLTGYVTVQGQVTRPGRYHLKGDMRVIDVLALAGGLTDKASVTQASLTRASSRTDPVASTAQGPPTSMPSTTEPLVLDGLLLRQEMDRNVLLKPGDIVTVPEDVDNKIYVIGDVKTPGVFLLKSQVTLLQAIAMAGGPQERGFATAKSAYIVRRNGNNNTPQDVAAGPAGPVKTSALPNGGKLITADLSAIMHDPGRDPAVQPGDVLVVPMSTMGGLQVLVNILAGIGYLLRF